jgi:hypothetical protein
LKPWLTFLTAIFFLIGTTCKQPEPKLTPCELEPDPGPCYAAIPKYYFNQDSGKCEEFIWGGCNGTVPFETYQECLDSCNEEVTTWPLNADSMNLAILVVDYQSYVFEGGYFSRYPICISCDQDSLPFVITSAVPADLGSVTIQYAPTGDTLFFATIIWAGKGRILFPDTLFPPEMFQELPTMVAKPSTVEYLEKLWLDSSTVIAKTDSVWFAVQSLDITNDFALHPFRVGFYFYAPAIGEFDPNPAKWIIFLYRGKFY